MATLTIRNLPEATKRALKERAARHDRSMEAEVRDILTTAALPDASFVEAWLTRTEDLRGDIVVPERSEVRSPITFD